MLPELLEVGMLVCFGFSWPVNVYKSIKAKSAKGKSLLFLVLIDLGYVSGISSKILNPAFNWSEKWWVFAVYVFNFVFVTADLVMYFINKNRDKKAEASKQ